MRKMIHRNLSLFLVIVFIITSFSGCSKSSKTDFNTTTTDTSGSNAKSNYTNSEPVVGAELPDNTAPINDGTEAAADSSTGTSKAMEGLPELSDEAYGIENKKLLQEQESNEFNMEEYNAIVENNFIAVKNNPLSTFSIDVDTASYSNIRRMIKENRRVEPDAVRLEEMINYFNYDYTKPVFGEPFSINTELSDCPWNKDAKLLLVGLQAKDIDLRERPSSNIVFLLDVSGSMDEPDKLPLVQKAFLMLTENLNENDRISIVTYAGEDSIVLEGARGDETRKISSAIENLTAGGSTAGAAGIETAYELAEDYFIKGGNNRVILATDGDLNVGITSEGALTRLIEKKREKGVFLSVLGFGTENIKDNKMEALADNGNGNYSYIDSTLEAKKVLVDEMGGTLFTVAKDVKLQLEFNPSKIKGYRLIGYENRRLNTEDFDDDTKDAGEIGAGHRVTALYELIPVDSAQEVPETNLIYQSNETLSNSKDWLTINIRYKEPDQDKSERMTATVNDRTYKKQMSDNLTFASAVASFGMLLRDSKWKGTSSYNRILNQLDTLNIAGDEYKSEFVELVKAMKEIDD